MSRASWRPRTERRCHPRRRVHLLPPLRSAHRRRLLLRRRPSRIESRCPCRRTRVAEDRSTDRARDFPSRAGRPTAPPGRSRASPCRCTCRGCRRRRSRGEDMGSQRRRRHRPHRRPHLPRPRVHLRRSVRLCRHGHPLSTRRRRDHRRSAAGCSRSHQRHQRRQPASKAAQAARSPARSANSPVSAQPMMCRGPNSRNRCLLRSSSQNQAPHLRCLPGRGG